MDLAKVIVVSGNTVPRYKRREITITEPMSPFIELIFAVHKS